MSVSFSRRCDLYSYSHAHDEDGLAQAASLVLAGEDDQRGRKSRRGEE